MKIFGKNAVNEALKSNLTIERLAVAKDLKDAQSNRIISLARSKGVKIVFLDKAVLDKESKGQRHQGFIAEVTDYQYCELEDILLSAQSQNQEPLIIMLDGVEDPHNLGSVLRVAECAGVHGVVIPRHRSASVNETVIKVSAGAAAHIKVAKVTNINDAIRYLKEQNIKVLAAETGGQNIYQTDLKGGLCVVVGGEDSGVKQLTKKLCDGIITLPMYGKVNSLNASVACGAVIYEIIRQRNFG
ncbi:MAG TPA: 23S rRNA (guanosine(2251)-2'-O)-methyltransferase RlmB [Clostridia bacterium]